MTWGGRPCLRYASCAKYTVIHRWLLGVEQSLQRRLIPTVYWVTPMRVTSVVKLHRKSRTATCIVFHDCCLAICLAGRNKHWISFVRVSVCLSVPCLPVTIEEKAPESPQFRQVLPMWHISHSHRMVLRSNDQWLSVTRTRCSDKKVRLTDDSTTERKSSRSQGQLITAHPCVSSGLMSHLMIKM